MANRVFPIELTDIELAQLEKLAAFEERDPADLLKALAIGGLAQARDRRRSDEIMTSGRTRRAKGRSG